MLSSVMLIPNLNTLNLDVIPVTPFRRYSRPYKNMNSKFKTTDKMNSELAEYNSEVTVLEYSIESDRRTLNQNCYQTTGGTTIRTHDMYKN